MKDSDRVSVPSYISANARKGIKLHKEGKSGDGLVTKTVTEAGQMADGSVSFNKLIRMNAWFLRHKSDLDAPKNSNPKDKKFPGPGAVAWYLWGGNPVTNPMKAQRWCEAKIQAIRNAEKKAKKKASLRQAIDKTIIESRYELTKQVEKGLEAKVEVHNEKYGNDKRKATTLKTLTAVFKRGVGAYKTNPESVRPNVKSPEQWAYARVNSFLYCLINLKFKSGKHDTDLLPKEHPMSSKK